MGLEEKKSSKKPPETQQEQPHPSQNASQNMPKDDLETINRRQKEKIEQLQQQNRVLVDAVKREAEISRQQEQLMLQQIKVTSIAQMLSAIAHHWRQPLTSVGFVLQNIKTAFKKGIVDDDYIDNSVRKGMKQIEMMSMAIDEFQNFLKPGKENESIDTIAAISEILSILSPQIQNGLIRLNIDTGGMKDAIITGLPFEFKQVLTNIINNAIFAIGRKIETGQLTKGDGQITIRIRRSEGKVTVEIINNGQPIPEDVIDRMFEPFYSAPGGAKGLGVGLYMAKFIIEGNMGGKIWCSNIEQGVMFAIELDAEG